MSTLPAPESENQALLSLLSVAATGPLTTCPTSSRIRASRESERPAWQAVPGRRRQAGAGQSSRLQERPACSCRPPVITEAALIPTSWRSSTSRRRGSLVPSPDLEDGDLAHPIGPLTLAQARWQAGDLLSTDLSDVATNLIQAGQ